VNSKTNKDNNDCFLDLKALSVRSCISVRTLRDYIRQGRPDFLPSYLIGGKRLIRWNDFLTWIARFKEQPDRNLDRVLKEVLDDIL